MSACVSVCMQGSDFHVPGQNFGAQPGGPVGGGGSSIGVQGGRAPPLGGIQTIGQSSPGIPPGQPQTISGIPSQSSQGSTTTPAGHSPVTQDMNKQTHLQTQPQVQPVYVQNPNRAASQNYYSNGPRPQQGRNISHRSTQPGNQNQVVGLTNVGATGQPPALYPHPSIAMQPSMFVQGQVSGLHTGPHQQNVYTMNNQMPMQFSGPPQRHQTHQNQFQYQSYQTHALLATSNLFSFTHGTQHPGFFYPQPPNNQLNINRGGGTAVGSNTQHISTSLTNNQGGTIVPQGSIQQQSQQPQTMHTMNIPIPPTDVYSGFNGSISNLPARSKKPRTKAIMDIVNPNTGKNVSAEIYKDDATAQAAESGNREAVPLPHSKAELVADFAARVAKLASESIKPSPIKDVDNSNVLLNPDSSDTINRSVDCLKSQFDDSTTIVTKNTSVSMVIDESLDTPNAEQKCRGETDFSTSDRSESVVTVTETTILNSSRDSSDLLYDEGKGNEKESTQDDNKIDLINELQNSGESTHLTKDVDIPSDDIVIESKIDDKLFSIDSRASDTQYQSDESLPKGSKEHNCKKLEQEAQKSDIQQKYADGKTMQKQKSKNKVKGRDINRRGTEKEVSDMDAFANPIQVSTSTKLEMKQDIDSQKDTGKEGCTELTKDLKEKDNHESKKGQDTTQIHSQVEEKNICNIVDTPIQISNVDRDISTKNKNNKETSLEETVSILAANDVVDHVYRNKIDKEFMPSIVAQKNEENIKVGLSNSSKESESTSNTVSAIATTKIKSMPPLKYTYSDDQWSPINTSGKKVYGREFLMKLQNDPNSKIKPTNLPDLDVVLKDSTKTRSPVDHRYKEVNLGRHDSLFPGFAKNSLGSKVPPPSKKSHSGKPKTNKPNVIHVSLSLREDVKLRETENAWKPTRLAQSNISEEQAKTDALYKKVRSVLNKLTPQKFETLVNQVRELQIDTQERLQGVIDLVFEKAVDEPNFSVAYALMCKELANMEVVGSEPDDSSSANFRKLILTRCQTEFEKNTVDENARSEKLKEIDECTDPERKKELQINLEEEERRMRIKSVGNIRFIGELFKQNMLTCKIMHQCIRHLLNQADEENLECLCKLLTTIGKALESKKIDLSEYFKQMQQIANRKGKISSRIRFMLQDVIDLRTNKWIPRRDDSNPKTMDQIQREAESERLDIQLSNVSLSTPRKDERSNEKKRNRGAPGSIEDGWSLPVRSRQVYSVETAKLKNKPPSMDDMQLGSRSNYQWAKPNPKMTTPNKFSYLEMAPEPDKRVTSIHLSGSRSTGPRDYGRVEYKPNYEGRNSRNGNYQSSSSSYNRDNTAIESSRSQSMSLMPSSKPQQSMPVNTAPQLTKDELHKKLNNFLEEFVTGEEDVKEAVKVFNTGFPVSVHESFVLETINTVMEKAEYHRNKASLLFAELLSHNCISLTHFKGGVGKIFEEANDLIIDIPMFWKYIANILVQPVINGTHNLVELKSTMLSLPLNVREDGHSLRLIAELLVELRNIKGSEWTTETWLQSELEWIDFLDNQAKIDQIISGYDLKFLTDYKNDSSVTFNVQKIHDKLLPLLKDSNFDDICNWIQVNVGGKVKEPKFIRTLMTAILETSIEKCNDKCTFKVETFDKLQKLIQRYVDADENLELQCLFAVQAYIADLSHPAGLLLKIMTYLYENNVISNEAFLAWEKNDDPAERYGKSVAMCSLKSFFIPLKEAEDNSSDNEA